MGKHPLIALVESKHLKKKVPVLRSGDVVRVHQRIVEAGKERIQVFEGLVISVSGSRGMDGSFTVRRIASGVGVERTFPLHSPKIAKIERVKASKVRKAKLYYIRQLTGRKARLRSDSVKAESWEELVVPSKPAQEDEVNEVVEESGEAEAPQAEDFETIEEAVDEPVQAPEVSIESDENSSEVQDKPENSKE